MEAGASHQAATMHSPLSAKPLCVSSPLPTGKSSNLAGRCRGRRPRPTMGAQKAVALIDETVGLCIKVIGSDEHATYISDRDARGLSERARLVANTLAEVRALPKQKGGSVGALRKTVDLQTEKKRSLRRRSSGELRALSSGASPVQRSQRRTCRSGRVSCRRPPRQGNGESQGEDERTPQLPKMSDEGQDAALSENS